MRTQATEHSPCSGSTIRAVMQAYRGLKRNGAGETWALESARRVFGYHEPHLSVRAAAAIVRDLVAREAG